MNPFLSAGIQSGLVLASASPRRREILEKLGFEFEVLPTGVDEEDVSWNDPVHSAKLLAELKAVEALASRPRKKIIAADTVVLCMGRRLGKPKNEGEAVEMLELLSGKVHEVVTAVALVAPPNRRLIEAERTKVYFRGLSKDEIERYVGTGEPFDKAGAYAIQGYASAFIEKIEGCYFNVVGLPVPLLFNMFMELEKSRGANEKHGGCR